MKKIAMLFSLIIFIPSFALAGEIYGTIKEGGKLIGEGVSVSIKCGSSSYEGKTDKYSSYRIYVREKGKCELKVNHKNQSPSTNITSYEGAIRYNLLLEMKGGKYTLRRE